MKHALLLMHSALHVLYEHDDDNLSFPAFIFILNQFSNFVDTLLNNNNRKKRNN
jgi:hypothetical protein